MLLTISFLSCSSCPSSLLILLPLLPLYLIFSAFIYILCLYRSRFISFYSSRSSLFFILSRSSCRSLPSLMSRHGSSALFLLPPFLSYMVPIFIAFCLSSMSLLPSPSLLPSLRRTFLYVALSWMPFLLHYLLSLPRC